MRMRGLLFLALLAGAGCSSDSGQAPVALTVTYKFTGTAIADSIKYDDGSGTLVKVTTPTLPWTAILSASAGSTVEAHAWGTVAQASSVMLSAKWSGGYVTDADTAVFVASASGPFTLGVAKRHIP